MSSFAYDNEEIVAENVNRVGPVFKDNRYSYFIVLSGEFFKSKSFKSQSLAEADRISFISNLSNTFVYDDNLLVMSNVNSVSNVYAQDGGYMYDIVFSGEIFKSKWFKKLSAAESDRTTLIGNIP